MSKVATKLIFQKIMLALEDDLLKAPPRRVDAVARFDGDVGSAVDEHVAELSGRAGSSILVGFTSEEAASVSAAGGPNLKRLPVAIILVQRREGNATIQQDAERLDDLMDTVEEMFDPHNPDARGVAFFHASNIIWRGRFALNGDDEWFGRSVNLDFIRANV